MPSKIPYLQKRETGYYYRQRIPFRLKPFFSQREIISSLKTDCPREGQRRALALHAAVCQLFEEVHTITDSIDHSQARIIADNWRKRILNDDFRRRVIGRSPSIPVHTQQQEILHSIQAMNFGRERDWIGNVMQSSGLEFKEGGEDWKWLGYYLMNAKLSATEEMINRDERGNVRMQFYDEAEKEDILQKPSYPISMMLKRWEGIRPRSLNAVFDWGVAVKRFIELKGDKDVREISKADIRDYRDTILNMPTHLPRKDRKLPILELMKKYEGTDVARLKPKTAKKYVDAVRSVLGVAMQDGYIDVNPAQNMTMNIPKTSLNQRLPFSEDDLKSIFMSSPVYDRGVRYRAGGGEAAYWLPLLALYTGARLEELGQLRLSDIREENGIFYLDLNEEDEGKSLKNAGSARKVPLHRHIIDAGFLKEVARQKDLNAIYVFPKLLHGDDKCTTAFSKWVNRYISKACGIEDRRKVFHSFRHTFKDACRRAGIPRDVHDALTGHTDGAVSSRYGLGFPMETLHQEINRVSYSELTVPCHFLPE